MKKFMFVFLLASPMVAQAAAPIAPVINPRVISVVTNNQDGRGNQFRATVIRQGDQDNSNLSLVVEQINYVSGGAGVILSQLTISPSQLKYGADTVVSNLKLSSSGFTFTAESMSTVNKVYNCLFTLPEEPVYGPQNLVLSSLSCQ